MKCVCVCVCDFCGIDSRKILGTKIAYEKLFFFTKNFPQ
jgi:hypothetical protein